MEDHAASPAGRHRVKHEKHVVFYRQPPEGAFRFRAHSAPAHGYRTRPGVASVIAAETTKASDSESEALRHFSERQ
jgi:hypothetical protein